MSNSCNISKEASHKLVDCLEAYNSNKHISIFDMTDLRKQLSDLLPIIEVHILRTVNSRIVKSNTTFNGSRRVYSARSYVYETRISMGENSMNPAMQSAIRNSDTCPIVANPAFAVNEMHDFYSDSDDTYYQCVVIDQSLLFLLLYKEEPTNDIEALVNTVHEFSANFVKHLIGILPKEKSVENFTATIPNAVYIAKRSGNHACSANYFGHTEQCTSEETITDLGVDHLRKFAHDAVHGSFVDPKNPVIGRYWISNKYDAPEDVSTFSFKAEDIDRIMS